jgi:hypothetical protein
VFQRIREAVMADAIGLDDKSAAGIRAMAG